MHRGSAVGIHSQVFVVKLEHADAFVDTAVDTAGHARVPLRRVSRAAGAAPHRRVCWAAVVASRRWENRDVRAEGLAVGDVVCTVADNALRRAPGR